MYLCYVFSGSECSLNGYTSVDNKNNIFTIVIICAMHNAVIQI